MQRWDHRNRQYVTGKNAWKIELSGWVNSLLGGLGLLAFTLFWAILIHQLQ